MLAWRYESLKHCLKQGKPALFPTDTVYGLGVAVRYLNSPQVLFDIKERPANKPVAWLVGSKSDLIKYGKDVPAYAVALAENFWPGALTLIVKANPDISTKYCSEEHTLGLRMPNSEFVCQLACDLDSPLATTSANISGMPAVCCYDELDSRLIERVEVCIPEDASASGIASTVVNCTQAKPFIVRQGDISKEEIDKVCIKFLKDETR